MSIRRSLVLAASAALLASCDGDTPAGPAGGGLVSLALRAEAPPALSRFGLNLAVEQVHGAVFRIVGDIPDTVASRTSPFSVNATTLNMTFNLLVGTKPETLQVSLDYQTATGQILFTAFQQVVAVAGAVVTPPALTPSYVGPGGNVASLAIQPLTATVLAGDTLAFSATALDIQGAQVSPDSVYLSWDASAGSVNALGRFRAPSAAGAVTLTAHTPNGVADTVVVNVLAAGVGVLAGQVVDGATGAGLAAANLTVFDAVDSVVATVQTAADGSFSTPPLPPGAYRVVASLNGYVSVVLFDALLNGGGANTTPVIPMVPATQCCGNIAGVVRDATTNQPIVGATVELRAGVNATVGTPDQSVVSDSVGGYAFVRPAEGTYTIAGIATGYTTGYRTSVSIGGSSSLADDVVLSPVGAGGNVRIVLQWDSLPEDLDAHFTGPDSTLGTRFHVYYADQGSLTGRPYASLDVDDTQSFGPETITIGQQFSGTYRFSVHDYSNSADTTSSRALAASRARVDVYIGGSLARSFFVPNAAGTLWTVFTLSGTTITPVNTMTFVSDETSINLRAGGSSLPGNDGGVVAKDLRRHPKR